MPEGPSLVILKELAKPYEGRTIAEAHGNSSAVPFDDLPGQPILSVRTWGKHFLIELPLFSLRVHFLMFGSYRIDERKEDSPPRLSLAFEEGGELNFYTCSVKTIDGALNDAYEWQADVMADEWKPAVALKKLRAMPDILVCDALLDQTVFSGVGNIIKNEVLFRLKIHPLSTIGALPATKLRELVKQARQYSFEFLEWKKAYVLKQHWLAHTKRICPRCNIALHKAHLGKTKRRTFWCERCQKRYGEVL
ncbi:DNA-formamidopyrimidine glycosylase family protein [Pseudoduganella armeniaca]|uniref:Endonuclease n=1 Tax=Pseudoduganella armeniaca TaxID=2072590 RepID=A0A2R4CG05_9BURK|nr:DNA-formamidopyrimidine glycosylase family protein [Pseudoduganella armeniaca]AVR98591.1 endonuclease [Pseudoduganella armeniaca]